MHEIIYEGSLAMQEVTSPMAWYVPDLTTD